MKNAAKMVFALVVLVLMSLFVTSCAPWDFQNNWSPWNLFGLPVTIIGLAVYVLPIIIAAVRRSKSLLGIILVNILAGWTFIGWIIALVWSLVGEAQKR